MLRLIFSQLVLGRPFMAPPGISDDRKLALRRAFDATMKDAEFLTDAEKMKLSITPLPGTKVQELIERLYKTPKDFVERAKAVIKP